MIYNTLLLLVVLIISCSSPRDNSYYISLSGNDQNDGSVKRPWKTIDRVNQVDLEPGDRLFFKGGETFSGSLVLKGVSGAPENRILISSFGEGTAVIEGGEGSALLLDSCRFLDVSNLQLKGSGRKTNRNGNGLSVSHSSFVRIRGLETSGFQNAGLWITGCDSITLERVRAFQNGFCGIATGHTEQTTRLVMRHCLAENNPGHPGITDNHSGSGILAASVKNALIEYCEACYNGWDMPRLGNGPVGIWTWNSDSVVIQYCLSHHNKSPDFDGGGFDLDGGVTNSIVQYNLSHHNSGAGYLICQFWGAPRELARNTLCFNISFEDGLSNHFAGIMIYAGGDQFRDALIHHNTIINSFHAAVNFDGVPQFLENPPVISFYNNLFISGKEQISNLHLMPNAILRGNLYWAYGDGGFSIGGYSNFENWVHITGYEKRENVITGTFTDPLLLLSQMSLEKFSGQPSELTRFVAFRPLPGSPLLNHGLKFNEIPGVTGEMKDFSGQPIAKDDRFIGAFK